jgi:hypothetical protein
MLCADPNATFNFWLTADEHKPEETRPMFVCRFMSKREHMKLRAIRNELEACLEDDDKSAALMEQYLSIGVVGWKNIPERFGEFAPAKIIDLLTDAELYEVIAWYPVRARMSEVDAKKSALPSPSDTAPAAAASNPPVS